MKIDVLDKGYVKIVGVLGCDSTIVESARVSYLAEAEDTDRLLRFLLENKHMSPFEHVIFRFKIKCPIYIARQWMRHRTGSYSEVSRRYTSKNIEFEIPSSFRKQRGSDGEFSNSMSHVLKSIYENWAKEALSEYEYLISLGVAREQARAILPVNMYTTFYFTMDLRNLLHFLNLRNSRHAQEEIKKYAEAIEVMLERFVPITMKCWKEEREE